MIIRLEENGIDLQGRRKARGGGPRLKKIRQKKFVYNPQTGEAVALQPLSGLFKNRKKIRKAKQAGKLARVEQRQTAKTQRAGTRQQKRQTRSNVNLTRQENRQVKLIGKREAQQAKARTKVVKQEAKQREAMEVPQEAQQEFYPDNSNDFDVLPFDYSNEAEGYDYMPSEAVELPEEYAEFEQLPSDTGYEEAEYFAEDNEQLGSVFGTIIKGAGNLIRKATGSATGQAVQGAIQTNNELQRLRAESVLMRRQIQIAERNNMLYGAGGIAIGALAGSLITSVIKSKNK